MCKRYGCALEAFVPSFQYARLNHKGFRVGNRKACLGGSLQCFRGVHWRFPCLHEHFGGSVPGVFVSYLQMALPHIEHRCCVQPKRKCFQIASQIRTLIVNACREDLYIVLSVGFSRIFCQGHLYRLFPFFFSLFFTRLACQISTYFPILTYTRHDDGSSMAGRYETTRSCAKDTAAHLRLLSHPFNMPASTTKASVSATGKLALAVASSVFEECIEDSLVYTNTLAGQCQVCLFHTFKWLYPT